MAVKECNPTNYFLLSLANLDVVINHFLFWNSEICPFLLVLFCLFNELNYILLFMVFSFFNLIVFYKWLLKDFYFFYCTLIFYRDILGNKILVLMLFRIYLFSSHILSNFISKRLWARQSDLRLILDSDRMFLQ